MEIGSNLKEAIEIVMVMAFFIVLAWGMFKV
jgi:hypothetical protein